MLSEKCGQHPICKKHSTSLNLSNVKGVGFAESHWQIQAKLIDNHKETQASKVPCRSFVTCQTGCGDVAIAEDSLSYGDVTPGKG